MIVDMARVETPTETKGFDDTMFLLPVYGLPSVPDLILEMFWKGRPPDQPLELGYLVRRFYGKRTHYGLISSSLYSHDGTVGVVKTALSGLLARGSSLGFVMNGMRLEASVRFETMATLARSDLMISFFDCPML